MTDATKDVRLSKLDQNGRALPLPDARTANSFAPTPVTENELRAI